MAERKNGNATERCADCVRRSIRTPSETARKGFIAAAQFFAMSTRGSDSSAEKRRTVQDEEK